MRGAAPSARGNAHPLAASGASGTGAKLTNRAPRRAGPAVQAANHGRDAFHAAGLWRPRTAAAGGEGTFGRWARGRGPSRSSRGSRSAAGAAASGAARGCGSVPGVLLIENGITESLILEKTAEIIRFKL